MAFRYSRLGIASAVLLSPAISPEARALIRFNEGRDEVNVTAGVTAAYDSNIYANNTGEGDIVTSSNVGLSYSRKAGMIGVEAEAAWNLGSFASNASEDFSNPSLGLAFTKNSGRTTGSLNLSAARESQADSTVGLRTDSWNYGADLALKYPVIERYSLAGSAGYTYSDYVDNSGGLVDLTSCSLGLDLNYAYDSKRQILAGYRIREGDTSNNNRTTDHSFTVGITGKILAKLEGSLRAGYQVRQDHATGQAFGSTTASGSATWTVNKRFKVTGTLSKDFNTSANESGTDSVNFDLNAAYQLNTKLSANTGLGLGYSDFITGGDTGREDCYATWNCGLGYAINQHFDVSLSYSYFHNWSNSAAADFDRHSVTLGVGTRW